jgi:hypothetical protein
MNPPAPASNTPGNGDAANGFAQTYAEARSRFAAAADAAGLDVHARVHPLLGSEGEMLALDVVLDGPPHARGLLIVSSGCHGVEGFCGSGIQVALLRDGALRERASRLGVAVLHLHALNPWGFSWLRRTTQENVDLNRNFHDFGGTLPANEAYDEIAHLLVPRQWPPPADVEQQLAGYPARHGKAALQAAISGGQHSHPQGLFYGGVNPTWSNVTLRHVLQEHARHCSGLGWIDLHSGLGPAGHGELIFAGRGDDAAGLARARAWWGGALKSLYDGSSVSAPVTGIVGFAAYDECPQAEITCMAIEYGTLPLEQVLHALRADQWLENHPEADTTGQRARIKREVRDAFYIDSDEWKRTVVAQAREAVAKAIDGLAV